MAGENNPYLAALPEFANLARYGGKDLETNIKAAAIRARALRQQLDTANTKARSFNQRNPLINENYEISPTIGFTTETVSASAAASLMAAIVRNSDVRKASQAILGKGRYDGISSSDIPFLVDFLRADDPNKSVEQLVEERLGRGLILKPKVGRTSAVGNILVPFKTEEGIVKPAVDTAGYRSAITSLDTFANQNIMPRNVRPETISVRIAATQQDFEAQYRAISNTDRDLSTAQGVNFTIRPDGTETKRSTDLDGTLDNKRTVILINHEVNSVNKGEFGGEDSVAETVLHEYGHTIHRSMGLDWGDPAAADSNPKTAKYAESRAQRVSDYGENNDQEHFAETFAKYLYTGDATPEFKTFLENEVGIKKFDLSAVYPELFLGNAARDSYLKAMREADLDGYSVRINSFSNPLQNASMERLRQSAIDAQNSGSIPGISISFSGEILDPQGRFAGEFTRTLQRDSDGKIWVYHNLYKMTPSAQGGGVGTKFINTSFELYKDWGAERVEVTAALDNGPYMWGLMGFDFMSDNDRTSKLSLARDYLSVLSDYNNNKSEYDGLTDAEVTRKIAVNLAQAGVVIETRGMRQPIDRILGIIMNARQNGWNVDNNFINELTYLLSLPKSQATANRIANLGRGNKRSSGKDTSTIGRLIMMSGSWRGRKYLNG